MIFYFVVIILIELILFSLILYLKKDFQWLITGRDLSIKIDRKLAKKFFDNSFDSYLGWKRKENSSFSDETENGLVRYSIAGDGSRKNNLFAPSHPSISSYGDSFCFGRLVKDTETWQYILSKKMKANVSNKGVGNYGLDQALLRFEMEVCKDSSEVVILNVVPETIARVHSIWKHYFEYGNTLAFKPVFKVIDGCLVLEECPIKNLDDLCNTALDPRDIADRDYFYRKKFLKDIIKFPYTLMIFKRPLKNIYLLIFIILDKLFSFKKSMAFELILEENKKWTEELFRNKDAKHLLFLLIKRFSFSASKNRKRFILLWTPQKVDLNIKTITLYRQFLSELENLSVEIIDMTDEFLSNKDNVYVNGKLGPHPSEFGNTLTAKKLYQYLHHDHENNLSI